VVLFILIPAAWSAVLLFVWIACRVGALSDESYAVALAEWVATSYLAEHEAPSDERPDEQLPPSRRAYRAAG
jgi:hypothetical protein